MRWLLKKFFAWVYEDNSEARSIGLMLGQNTVGFDEPTRVHITLQRVQNGSIISVSWTEKQRERIVTRIVPEGTDVGDEIKLLLAMKTMV